MSYPRGPYQQFPQYPPTYPPPHPPQPPSQRPRSRWPRFDTNDGVLLYVAAPLAAVLLVTALAAGIVGAIRPHRQARATPIVQPTLAPYPTVTAYPTPTPAPPAVLGATESAFTAAYGDPTMRASVPWYSFTAPDGTPLSICLCEQTAGKDRQPRADILSFGPADPNAAWGPSEEQLVGIALSFAPADAVHQNDIHDPDVGTLHVYRSATLAATFPAGAFENTGSSGGLVPPGTFVIACAIPGAVGCDIRVGT